MMFLQILVGVGKLLCFLSSADIFVYIQLPMHVFAFTHDNLSKDI